MSVRSCCRGFLVLVATTILVACGSHRATGQLLYQEGFEGDDSKYELFDDGFEFTGDSGPGMWGLNVDADQIGLQQNAPARRAAILWNHEDPVEPMEDIISKESLEVWSSLVKWAVGGKENATVGVFPTTFPVGVEVVTDVLETEGYSIVEVLAPEEAVPEEMDVLIHSSEQASTAFAELAIPIISFESSTHDDTAIAGIGQAIDFFEPIELNVNPDAAGHEALGGKAGTIPWTSEPAQMHNMGKTHNGGTVLATVVYEDPVTGDDTEGAAIFVIEEGDPLLGAFNPDPEGDKYVVGGALNKFGEMGEKTLTTSAIDISGKSDLSVSVLLAATAADFEPGDYLRIEAIVDGDEPVILEEFWGVDDGTSDCNKGLSNGEFAGEEGDICLPTEAFGDFNFPLPEGNELMLNLAALNTWGNELVGIDNIRVFSGPTSEPGDYNGDGALDAADLDLQAEEMAKENPNLDKFDENGDNVVDIQDRTIWAKNLRGIYIGDANFDSEFNSGDLVAVFTTGKYESGRDAGWADGDWNGDGKFDSGDFVVAFSDGGYEAGPFMAAAAVPEPSSMTIVLLGFAMIAGRIRRRRS